AAIGRGRFFSGTSRNGPCSRVLRRSSKSAVCSRSKSSAPRLGGGDGLRRTMRSAGRVGSSVSGACTAAARSSAASRSRAARLPVPRLSIESSSRKSRAPPRPARPGGPPRAPSGDGDDGDGERPAATGGTDGELRSDGGTLGERLGGALTGGIDGEVFLAGGTGVAVGERRLGGGAPATGPDAGLLPAG